MIKKFNLTTIFLFGIALKLVLSAFTLHPDLLGHMYSVYNLPFKGITNIYDYLQTLPEDHPMVKNLGTNYVFIYPPLAYFTLGGFMFLLKPLYSLSFIENSLLNPEMLYTYPSLFVHSLLFKLPYLAVDFGIASLLLKISSKESIQKKLFTLWWLNPVTLYATYMMGQLDLLPVFFTVLSLYLYQQKKLDMAALSLGFGIAFKSYPVFLLVPAALIGAKNISDYLKRFIIGTLPLLVTSLPYLSSPHYRSQVLFAPQTQKMLYLSLPVSGADFLYPFVIGFMVIFFLTHLKPSTDYFSQALKIYISVLLLFFSVTNFHPQWFLWVAPFLTIYLIMNPARKWLFTSLLLSFLVLILSFEASLNYAIINPLIPSLRHAPPLFSFLPPSLPAELVRSLTRSIFAAASAVVVWDIWQNSSSRQLS